MSKEKKLFLFLSAAGKKQFLFFVSTANLHKSASFL